MRRVITIISMLSIFLFVSSFAFAAAGIGSIADINYEQFQVTEGLGACTGKVVCGAVSPNSFYGFGAVEICGECYPCGVEDGVCPEDFSEKDTRTSCRGCPDPDCMTPISGIVRRESDLAPVPGVKVVAYYGNDVFQPVSSVLTDALGQYFGKVPSGFIRIFVSDSMYDSPLMNVDVIRGVNATTDINITKALCNDDCTGAYGETCKASCASNDKTRCFFGDASGETFGNPDKDGVQVPGGKFYTTEELAVKCDYVTKSNRVYLETVGDIKYNWQCCEGPLEAIEISQIDMNIAGVDNSNIDNLQTSSIPVLYNGMIHYLNFVEIQLEK